MPRLTDQEQQDIIRFLEADKPLPDKYRFLLFEDKREVELVWNGKTSEVSNIVLPFQVIEQVDEPRSETDTQLQPSLFDVDERGRQLVVRAVPVDENQLAEVVDAIDCMTRAASNLIYAYLTVQDEEDRLRLQEGQPGRDDP